MILREVGKLCRKVENSLSLAKLGMDFEDDLARISGLRVKDLECPKCEFEWAESHPDFCLVDMVCPRCGMKKEGELW